VGPGDAVAFDDLRTHNFIAVVELGLAPYKDDEGVGANKFRWIQYPERRVEIRVDNRKLGLANAGVDLFYQAVTRGMSSKEKVQLAKDTGAMVLSLLPGGIFLTGAMRSTRWALTDIRSWNTLPGEIHVFGTHLAPGSHSFEARFLNDRGIPLGRLRRQATVMIAEGQPRDGQLLLVTSPSNDDLFTAPSGATEGKKTVQIKRQIGSQH
jgi:hypothetical protein